MNLKYIVVKNTYIDGKISRVGYGIALVQEQDGIPMVLDSVSDLSPDLCKTEKLAETCNSCQLSSLHFRDVVNDFLSSL